MIVVAQAATYFVQPGEYQREHVTVTAEAPETVVLPDAKGVVLRDGREVLADGERQVTLPAGTRRSQPGRKVIPGTYRPVEATPLPWHAALTRIPKGMQLGAEIIFFVFIVGGVIAVVRQTGAIDALIEAAIRRLGGRPWLLAGGMVTLFALGSSTIGMAEEYMPFVPILVAMCLAMRMDAVVAMGIVYIGAGVGYGCAALNPFTVAIAKDIAGVPLAQGALMRWGLLAVMIVVGVDHILRYARRIRSDPGNSLVADVDYSAGFTMPENVTMNARRAVILIAFASMILLFVWGVQAHEWYLVELAALFLGMALLAAIVDRMHVNVVAQTFYAGAAQLTSTALLIGFARTIQVVLDDARVTHTVIHAIAESLHGLPAEVSALGMLGVQSVCNFFVPSGSGQAYVTMPIMAPLADLTGVGREAAILAYQLGDGLTNMIVPTNALLMGMLMLGKIPYQRWLRFIVPLLLKLYVVAVIAVIVATRVYRDA